MVIIKEGGKDQDILANASAQSSSALVHDVLASVNNGTQVNTTLDDLRRYGARINWTQITPENIPASAFKQNDVPIDFLIPKAGVHTLKEIYFVMNLRNTDVTVNNTLGLPGSDFLFSRIEEWADGAGASNTIYPEIAWSIRGYNEGVEKALYSGLNIGYQNDPMTVSTLGAAYVQNQNVQQYYDHNGLTQNALDTGFVLTSPANGFNTKTLYYSCKLCLTAAKLFLGAIIRQPKIRLYCKQDPWLPQAVGGGGPPAAVTGSLSLDNMSAYMFGNLYAPNVFSSLLSTYKSRPTVSRTMVFERQMFPLNVTTNALTGSIPLTNFTGQYSALILMLRHAVTNFAYKQFENDNANGLQEINAVTLFDSGGDPITFQQFPTAILKRLLPGKSMVSWFPESKRIYLFPFTMAAAESLIDNANYGGIQIDSAYNLQILPNVTDANTQLMVMGVRYGACVLDEMGNVSIIKF